MSVHLYLFYSSMRERERAGESEIGEDRERSNCERERERAREGKTERDLTVFYSKSMSECVLCLFYSNIILHEAPRTYITWICII